MKPTIPQQTLRLGKVAPAKIKADAALEAAKSIELQCLSRLEIARRHQQRATGESGITETLFEDVPYTQSDGQTSLF